MSAGLRVAVLGAGRIGRQHAKWYRMEGCHVAAFLGSSPESVARTEAALREMLGAAVPGYTDLGRLLAEARPHAVSVCSPHPLHCEHALRAIGAGVHVLCEKPLAWDPGKSYEEILADGRRMVDAAERDGVLLGLNAQYVAGMPAYRQWYEEVRGPLERATSFEAVMQSRGRAASRGFAEIWVDLGSHPLSLILKWSLGVVVEPDSMRCRIRRREVAAEFRCASPATGNTCDCLIRLGHEPEAPLQRRFGVNGFLLDYEGRNDARGVFRTYLRRGDCEREYPDLLHASIAHFVRAARGEAELLIPAAEAYRNLELQIDILRRGEVEPE